MNEGVQTRPRRRLEKSLGCCLHTHIIFRSLSLAVVSAALGLFIYCKVKFDTNMATPIITGSILLAVNIPPLTRTIMFLRGTGPRPFRCEALLGSLWEFAIFVASIIMGIIIIDLNQGGRCRGWASDPKDCDDDARMLARKLTMIGGILLIPNGILNFVMIFLGCVPLGLTPAYGSLVDDEDAEPLRPAEPASTPAPAPAPAPESVAVGVARPEATYVPPGRSSIVGE